MQRVICVNVHCSILDIWICYLASTYSCTGPVEKTVTRRSTRLDRDCNLMPVSEGSLTWDGHRTSIC